MIHRISLSILGAFCGSIILLIIFLEQNSGNTFAEQPSRKAVVAKHGMVVCASPIAADVGLAILKKGGNAIDATIATAFAEAVTYPIAGNIGGGGFMLIH